MVDKVKALKKLFFLLIPVYILVLYIVILNFTVSAVTLFGNFILVVNAKSTAAAMEKFTVLAVVA